MPHIDRKLIRKRAEHNEGIISTLEEISLHQEELESISEVLGSTCRKLKILYLQNNIIPKMENLHHMKELEYLNLALNNIEKIEGLDRCEFLNKLDLTVNFVDFDTLEESISNLVERHHLRDLYMMGNPSQMEWEEGFEQYVVHRLPQLRCLDGKDITKSMRIVAAQHFPRLDAELRLKAEECRERKAVEAVAKREAAEAKANRKAAKAKRKAAQLKKQEKLAAGSTRAPGKDDRCNVVEEEDDDDDAEVKVEDAARDDDMRQIRSGLQAVGVHVKDAIEEDDDLSGEEDSNSEDELHAHTPENRVEMYRELAEEKAEKEAREKERAPKERDYEKEQKEAIERTRKLEEEGRIRQCNDGKWAFSFDETKGTSSRSSTGSGGSEGACVVLDVSVPRHLDSSLIDVDVHPNYVSVVIKSKVLRLNLPAEVDADRAKAKRSKTTGHLVLIMPKCNPEENALSIRVAARDREKKAQEAKAALEAKQRTRDQGKLAHQMVTAAADASANKRGLLGGRAAAPPTGGAVKLTGLVPKSKGGLDNPSASPAPLMTAVATTAKTSTPPQPPPESASPAREPKGDAVVVVPPPPPSIGGSLADDEEEEDPGDDDEPPPLM